MADTAPSPTPPTPAAAATGGRLKPSYDWLRWSIRITGILLMFGGTIYLGIMAAKLLTDQETDSGLFGIIGAVIALGVGIYVLRIGFNMLRSINPHTIGSFSFLFALIYTFILIQILPSSWLLGDHPALIYLLIFLYFGLSYWILKSILFHLLLARNER